MTDVIPVEIRGFGGLRQVFADRQWSFPLSVQLERELTGPELLEKLEIPRDQVEAIMINGLVRSFDQVIKPGDRVALVPPGTPGPYRVLLGIVERKNPSDD